jgi:hypothetical protein
MRGGRGFAGLASHAVSPLRWKSPLPYAVVTEPRRADRTRTRHERAPKSSPARSAVDVRGRARDATPTAMPLSVQSNLVRAGCQTRCPDLGTDQVYEKVLEKRNELPSRIRGPS